MLEENSIKRRSVCSVKAVDYNGIRWLTRIGDIDSSGRIVTYNFDPDEPMIFDNRNRIFWKDGPTDEGFVGIWDWSAITNKSDSDKDYIESHYDPSESPIEIFEVASAYSVEDLVNCLKEGVSFVPSAERVMYAYKPTYGSYEGVLCEKKNLIINENKSKISEDLAVLNVYSFNDQDIYTYKTRDFYKYLNPDKPDQVILVKSHTDIVKDVVLRHISWSVAKQHGMTKNDWKRFRELLGSLSDESLYQEIASSCNCGVDEAKKHLEQFLEVADRKLEESDIEDAVLADIIGKNVSLRSKCEKLVEEKWEINNQEKIQDKLQELENVTKEVEKQNEKKAEISKSIKKENEKLEKIMDSIAHYEELGEAVMEKVKNKIGEARSDAAEFISQLTMLSPVYAGISPVQEAFYEGKAYVSGNDCFDGEINNYGEAVESIADELVEAGVEVKYTVSLAAYLYSAFENHANLLLAGPNGESIANAFSIGLFGKYAGVLDCNQAYSSQVIEEFVNSDDEIIIVKRPFRAEWRDEIIELLSTKGKCIILLNPFVEDLMIEPRGLYNYTMPLFTEIIVENEAKNAFYGKKQTGKYQKYESPKLKHFYDDLLSSCNVNTLITNRFQRVLTDMHYLDKSSDNTPDYLYFLFPYAYLCGKGEIMIEKLKNEHKADKKKVDCMLKWLGETE